VRPCKAVPAHETAEFATNPLIFVKTMDERHLFHLFDILDTENIYKSAGTLRYYLNYVFQDMILTDRVVLDIGCGSGIMAAYAAYKGAKLVVGLEPEASGAKTGYLERGRKIIEALNLNYGQIQILPYTIQGYDSRQMKFDVILMHNSINHLDEKACRKLHFSHASRQNYIGIFKKVSDLLNCGGTLVILDCSRYNFWPLLRVKNPFCPQIQWEKHQSPQLWIELLQQCGLKGPRIQWASFRTLRWLGKPLQNRFTAFFFTSHFRLVMHK
jgi:SAM-dependent methyltransferase